MNELDRVEQANTRPGRVDYDLAYSEQTEKFRVSPEMFDELDMDNHGLTLYERKSQNQLILAAEPNEQAVMHRGKEGYQKGREFKSTRMRVKMDQYGMAGVNNFTLAFWDTDERGYKCYIIKPNEEPDPEKQVQTTQPVDYVPVEDPEEKQLPEKQAEQEDQGDIASGYDPTQPETEERAPEDPDEDPPYGDVGAPPTPEEEAIPEQEEDEEDSKEEDDSDFDDLDSLLQ